MNTCKHVHVLHIVHVHAHCVHSITRLYVHVQARDTKLYVCNMGRLRVGICTCTGSGILPYMYMYMYMHMYMYMYMYIVYAHFIHSTCTCDYLLKTGTRVCVNVYYAQNVLIDTCINQL